LPFDGFEHFQSFVETSTAKGLDGTPICLIERPFEDGVDGQTFLNCGEGVRNDSVILRLQGAGTRNEQQFFAVSAAVISDSAKHFFE
jgi:hypothetical protein